MPMLGSVRGSTMVVLWADGASRQAHDLLDSLEAKGGGSRGGVRNPSNYIGAAVNRMVGESGGGGPRKRTRTEYERPQYEDDRRGRGRVGRGDSMVAEEARRMGLSLDGEALEALERQNEDDALQLLDQASLGASGGVCCVL